MLASDSAEIHRGHNVLKRLPHTFNQTFILMSTTHTFKPVFVIAPHLSPYRHFTRKFFKAFMSSSSSENSQTSTQYSSTPTHHSQLDLTDVEQLLGESVTSPQVRSDSGSPPLTVDAPLPTAHAPLHTSSPLRSLSGSSSDRSFASPDHGPYQQLPSQLQSQLPSSPSRHRYNRGSKSSPFQFVMSLKQTICFRFGS